MMYETLILVFVEIAYLATGLILCFMGKNLIENGFKTSFKGEGKFGEKYFKILTTSPGIVFMLAGLVIVGLAINQTSEIRNKILIFGQNKNSQSRDSVSVNSEIPDTNSTINKYATLLKRIQVVRFAKEEPLQKAANDHVKLAKRKIKKDQMDLATAHLAIAVVNDPSILDRIINDRDLEKALHNQYLDQIIRSRFSLPLRLNDENLTSSGRSPIADNLIRKLKGIVALYGEKKTTFEDRNIAITIPITPNEESRSQTINKLEQLLDLNPTLLLEVLEEPGYSWLLNDEAITDSLYLALEDY